MSEYIKISPEIRALGLEAEREIRPYFERLEEICDRNTEKVLAAFAKNRVSDNLFAGTTGYGYDDYGRDTLDKIYADIFRHRGRTRAYRLCKRHTRAVLRDVFRRQDRRHRAVCHRTGV